MLLTRLGLPTSTYKLHNIINPSSSYFKFVIGSEFSDQIAFCSGLKTKKWRKLEQHSIKNHSRMAQWVEQLTCIQEVAGSNPAGEKIFFENQFINLKKLFLYLSEARSSISISIKLWTKTYNLREKKVGQRPFRLSTSTLIPIVI